MTDRLHIDSRIRELVSQYGSLRAAAKAVGLSASYLSRLSSGEKIDPSLIALRKLGLKRVTYYTTLGSQDHD